MRGHWLTGLLRTCNSSDCIGECTFPTCSPGFILGSAGLEHRLLASLVQRFIPAAYLPGKLQVCSRAGTFNIGIPPQHVSIYNQPLVQEGWSQFNADGKVTKFSRDSARWCVHWLWYDACRAAIEAASGAGATIVGDLGLKESTPARQRALEACHGRVDCSTAQPDPQSG